MAGADGDKSLAWPEPEAWTRAVLTMRATLLRQPDLSSQLLQFAASHARTSAQRQVPSS